MGGMRVDPLDRVAPMGGRIGEEGDHLGLVFGHRCLRA
jgi:hypothetical protein